MPSNSYTAPADRIVRRVSVKLVIIRCVAKVVHDIESHGRFGHRSLLGVSGSG